MRRELLLLPLLQKREHLAVAVLCPREADKQGLLAEEETAMAGINQQVVEASVGVWVCFLRQRVMLDVASGCLAVGAQWPRKGETTATGLRLELLAAAVKAQEACVAPRGVPV